MSNFFGRAEPSIRQLAESSFTSFCSSGFQICDPSATFSPIQRAAGSPPSSYLKTFTKLIIFSITLYAFLKVCLLEWQIDYNDNTKIGNWKVAEKVLPS